MNNYLKWRYYKNFLFKICCFASLGIVFLIICLFFFKIISNSYLSLLQPQIKVYTNDLMLNASPEKQIINLNLKLNANLNKYKRIFFFSAKASNFLDTTQQDNKNYLWLPASNVVGSFLKDSESIKDANLLAVLNNLKNEKLIKLAFSFNVFKNTDSREPESAGIIGGLIGSIIITFIAIFLVLPIGVLTAIYLEEFSKRNFLYFLLEVNINNLATIPPIVYGLLGLSVYIGFFNLPRSSLIVTSLTVATLTLPTIIILAKQSIQSVPTSIRRAALALGASPLQTTFHHVLPTAMPGIITSIILCISRILGETAPLMILGAIAFIKDIPDNIFAPSTTLPVLIYNWSRAIENAYQELASIAILSLMILISFFNYLAIKIKDKYEFKW